MIFCRKFQQELLGLDAPPFPGPKGLDIYENISQKAWKEWLEHQTMLINERRLNMINSQDRVFLQKEMSDFFTGKEYSKINHYTPPSTKDQSIIDK
ncbi:UNVERIFIED_CONTAM: hypothetical protein GTU68_052168 [Idotea baltica]|nr:hypothetical protein [Idotea baltica]